MTDAEGDLSVRAEFFPSAAEMSTPDSFSSLEDDEAGDVFHVNHEIHTQPSDAVNFEHPEDENGKEIGAGIAAISTSTMGASSDQDLQPSDDESLEKVVTRGARALQEEMSYGKRQSPPGFFQDRLPFMFSFASPRRGGDVLILTDQDDSGDDDTQATETKKEEEDAASTQDEKENTAGPRAESWSQVVPEDDKGSDCGTSEGLPLNGTKVSGSDVFITPEKDEVSLSCESGLILSDESYGEASDSSDNSLFQHRGREVNADVLTTATSHSPSDVNRVNQSEVNIDSGLLNATLFDSRTTSTESPPENTGEVSSPPRNSVTPPAVSGVNDDLIHEVVKSRSTSAKKQMEHSALDGTAGLSVGSEDELLDLLEVIGKQGEKMRTELDDLQSEGSDQSRPLSSRASQRLTAEVEVLRAENQRLQQEVNASRESLARDRANILSLEASVRKLQNLTGLQSSFDQSEKPADKSEISCAERHKVHQETQTEEAVHLKGAKTSAPVTNYSPESAHSTKAIGSIGRDHIKHETVDRGRGMTGGSKLAANMMDELLLQLSSVAVESYSESHPRNRSQSVSLSLSLSLSLSPLRHSEKNFSLNKENCFKERMCRVFEKFCG